MFPFFFLSSLFSYSSFFLVFLFFIPFTVSFLLFLFHSPLSLFLLTSLLFHPPFLSPLLLFQFSLFPSSFHSSSSPFFSTCSSTPLTFILFPLYPLSSPPYMFSIFSSYLFLFSTLSFTSILSFYFSFPSRFSLSSFLLSFYSCPTSLLSLILLLISLQQFSFTPIPSLYLSPL